MVHIGGQRSAIVLILAALLDYGLGDPKTWWHPVQSMGWVITRYTTIALKRLKRPLALRLAGVGLTLGLVLGSGAIGWGVVALGRSCHPWLGIALETIVLASCFAARSLRDAAEDVLSPLQQRNLEASRQTLSQYVGRDTAHLPEPEILRAVLETVTENATDGVLAPLFYAGLGSLLGIGGVPFALAYKAASTLDSMVGYREAPYTYLGWFSARLDDVLTWVPCRLVVVTLMLLSGRPRHVWRLCCRDAPQDPSPNSGWSETVYAASLGVQMGGTNWYGGIAKLKPLLGDATTPITAAIIRRALELTRIAFLLWLGAIAALLLISVISF
jgi:adenosylcobinamide-phosphate synthase